MDAGHLFIYEYYLGRLIPGGVAQLGEHLPCKQGVMSSNLTISIQDDESSHPAGMKVPEPVP